MDYETDDGNLITLMITGVVTETKDSYGKNSPTTYEVDFKSITDMGGNPIEVGSLTQDIAADKLIKAYKGY